MPTAQLANPFLKSLQQPVERMRSLRCGAKPNRPSTVATSVTPRSRKRRSLLSAARRYVLRTFLNWFVLITADEGSGRGARSGAAGGRAGKPQRLSSVLFLRLASA